MDNLRKTEAFYLFYSKYMENPRISTSEFHRLQTVYKAENSTTNLLKEALDKKIIVGPFIYCNSGITVEIKDSNEVEDPIDLLESCKGDPAVMRAVALLGEHSFICFRKGASLLTYAEAISPTLHSTFSIENVELNEKGTLPKDEYPRCWDNLDWETYHLMRNPRISFAKASGKMKKEGKLNVTWKTIATHYEKIINDCKTWIAFFPRGMKDYSQTFLSFKTEYETDLRKELQKLDRTTYLYKVGETIFLNLFLDNNIQHRVFMTLKKKGLIRDLHVSIPLYFWTPFPI
jgi:hypothetical protein